MEQQLQRAAKRHAPPPLQPLHRPLPAGILPKQNPQAECGGICGDGKTSPGNAAHPAAFPRPAGGSVEPGCPPKARMNQPPCRNPTVMHISRSQYLFSQHFSCIALRLPTQNLIQKVLRAIGQKAAHICKPFFIIFYVPHLPTRYSFFPSIAFVIASRMGRAFPVRLFFCKMLLISPEVWTISSWKPAAETRSAP